MDSTVVPLGDWHDVPAGSVVGAPPELPVGTVLVSATQRLERTDTGWVVDGEPSTWSVVLTLLLAGALARSFFTMVTPVRQCLADDCDVLFVPVSATGMKRVYHDSKCQVRQGRREGRWK